MRTLARLLEAKTPLPAAGLDAVQCLLNVLQRVGGTSIFHVSADGCANDVILLVSDCHRIFSKLLLQV